MITACATQRYGRLTPLSEVEKKVFTCKEIEIEIAKANEFLSDIRIQRANTSGAHILGFLGDFGIGNVIEGDAAILSGETRLKELGGLKTAKDC